MSLLETIKGDALKARKAGDRTRANLLITLLSEAEMVGKNAGNRESTDEEVTTVIRKFLKNINETLNDERINLDADKRSILDMEKTVLSSYVPTELSPDELRAAIREVGTDLTVKDTGRVKSALEVKYPGRVNAKAVSEVLKAGV